MKWLFLLLIECFVPVFQCSAPFSCAELSTTANQTSIDSSKNFTNFQFYSAKLKLFKNETAAYVKIYDVVGYDSTWGNITGYCYLGATQMCVFNVSNNYVFTLDKFERSVSIDGRFFNLEIGFFSTYVDEESICQGDGMIYTPEYPCISDINNTTTCCTSFAPTTEVVGNFPRCIYFKSRSTVHNPIDFSIVATTSMNYFLIDYDIFLRGNYSLANIVRYNVNGRQCESNFENGLNCTFYLPRGDIKYFLSTELLMSDIYLYFQIPSVPMFLIRNSQTLMKEGIPYTKENNCQYFSVRDNYQQMPASVEVCCKNFE
uniref:Uncharacterized protein n=1 Tax=Panagrolaimus sp. ES5 TaxID=591445 RepID=A0AC34FD84_9BILA